MNIKLQLKSFVSLILLVSNTGMAEPIDTRANTLNDALTPEATLLQVQGSFWKVPELEDAFISSAPEDRKDGHQVGTLRHHSQAKQAVLQFANEIAQNKHGEYTSMLISFKDQLVFESYYLRGRVNLPHDQASAVKGYTSLLLGRAIQLGYLTMDDLHKPLINFLPKLKSARLAQGAHNITLHKALTMSGGLQISDEKSQELAKSRNELSKKVLQRLQGQGFIQEILEHTKPITPASQIYRYGNYNPTLVMQVIEAVVPGSAADFIRKELLNKIGISDYRWATAISGLPEDGWRVSMTSRDMLKLANLVKNGGKWQGEQLISPQYLATAMQKQTRPIIDWMPDHYSYGYFWYQTDVKVKNKTYNANIAWGAVASALSL
ncbi:serine hydrolase domain-containing protein [Pseudoalteromonas luteoviolacea]|uniref:serine hydrolase domain-containing protein n=1 Tax=Pseudoalteromonas luteoviolacea TaxID=43657 RepID=UPI000A686388|nr:serine hydrolase [Pseudoalteromonas luteoviolacea]